MTKLQLTSSALAASLLLGSVSRSLGTEAQAQARPPPQAQSETLAQPQNAPPPPPRLGDATGASAHAMSYSARLATPPRADIKPFERAKLSLSQAISEAQRLIRGKTLDARFEQWHGKPAYVVRTYTANEIWQARIDANNAQPVGRPQRISDSQLGHTAIHEIASLGNAQTSLEKALSGAEQQRGGKAIMVSLRSTANGAPSYRLDLMRNGRLHSAMVNGKTGERR